VATTETIRVRVESSLEAEAEEVLDQIGLTASEAIRLFCKQISMRRGLPFDVVIPNATTRPAMRDVREARGPTRYADTQVMFEEH
jgi:DNA-damage-inducible protein J